MLNLKQATIFALPKSNPFITRKLKFKTKSSYKKSLTIQMEPTFMYMMILLGIAIIVVIIVLFTVNWWNPKPPVIDSGYGKNDQVNTTHLEKTQNSNNSTNQEDQSGEPVDHISINISSLLRVDEHTPIKIVKINPQTNDDVTQNIIETSSTGPETDLIKPSDAKEPSSTTAKFTYHSTELLNSLFDSIDDVLNERVINYNPVEYYAKLLADSLCDANNATTLIKSYLNLEQLLRQYTRVSHDMYLDTSGFSEISSGIGDRSISPSGMSDHSKASLSDIKRQAGMLTIIINGIYYKCLDLSSGSNHNFKTYLSSLNTLLFKYSQLTSEHKLEQAKLVREKAVGIASGAILSSRTD